MSANLQSRSAAHSVDAEALDYHRFYRGKLQTATKCPIGDLGDFALLYTPGVAAPCRAIQEQPETVFDYTNRGNTVAIISDGTRVLGLGNIGPEAGLPVMEGKALLFKYLGGVDAVPLCVRTHSLDELVDTVKALEPSFGGINLEDIAQPGCFRVLDRLRRAATIPIWHDDQQGSATVALAALTNALKIVGKRLGNVKIVLVGIGAANVPTFRLLVCAGADPGRIVACDTEGTLHSRRDDLERVQDEFPEKWTVCQQSNKAQITGGIAEALHGADVCIAFSSSGPGVIRPEWIRGMASDAIVFACANPVPEIWPWEAKEGGARIVGTGRSDFPNQVNNSLAFPGIFRGALDVRARAITDGMAMAAAHALADEAEATGLRDDRILPTMEDWRTSARVAAATALQAQREGVAHCVRPEAELYENALERIATCRRTIDVLCREGILKQRSVGLR
ncbi:MAG TPA: NADP-dependent malic enzyme [Planctomycetaceae bacterium]|nr:NADP-dependent malic enzyme [Planctomycetaceae bacterium]